MRNLQLTPRECATARCLLHGWSDKRIAAELTISTKTVKRYLWLLGEKTGMNDRLGLVVFFLRVPWALGQVMETPDFEVVPAIGAWDIGC